MTELNAIPVPLADLAALVAAELTGLDGTYVRRSLNGADFASIPGVRTVLGLGGAALLAVGTIAGTVAAGDDSRITGAAQKAANLSDLANVVAARANLSLGTMAVQAASAVAITGGTAAALAITGGTINSAPIGGTTRAAGAFSEVAIGGAVSGNANRLLTLTNPAAIAVGSAMVRVGGNFSGTNLGASFAGAGFVFAVDSDTITFSDTSNGYTAAYFGQTLSAGWSGGRTLSFDFLNIAGAGTAGSSSFHAARGSEVRANAWMGGTPGAERGSPFGDNVLARVYGAAGPHLRQVFGDEFDYEVRDGALVLWKGGVKTVQFASDVRRGLQQDFAFSAGMQANIPDGFPVNRAPGVSIVYAIGGKEGWNPLTETSSVMRAISGGIVNGPALASATGIDFSNFVRVRESWIKGPGARIDGAGNLGATVAAGVALQTNGELRARTAVVAEIETIDTGLYGGVVTIAVPGGVTAVPAAYGIAASFSLTAGGSGFAADDTFEVDCGPPFATGTAEIAGDVLTVTVASTGTFGVGQTIATMTGVTAGTRIVAMGTGTGGTGTYTVSVSQTVASTAITTLGGTTTAAATGTAEIAGDVLTVTAAASGLFGVGQVISSMAGALPGTRITALGTGSGGTGTYTVSASQTVASAAITTTGPAIFAGTIADNVLTVSAMVSGIITDKTFLIHDHITDRTRIIAFGTGTGGVGTYTLDTSQRRSTTMTGIRAGGPAEGKVARVNSGAVSGFRMTNPGYYTVLPAFPVATRATMGSGASFTFNPAVNIMAVTVTGAGGGFSEHLPPVPVASGTLGDYRDATFKVGMTASAATLSLNAGDISVAGIPTSAAGLPAGRLWSDAGTLKVA